MNKNIELPIIHGSKGATPLYMAALVGHKDMVRYLNCVTEEGNLTKEDHIGLLVAAITADLFDVAFHMLHEDSELAIVWDGNGTPSPSSMSSTILIQRKAC